MGLTSDAADDDEEEALVLPLSLSLYKYSLFAVPAVILMMPAGAGKIQSFKIHSNILSFPFVDVMHRCLVWVVVVILCWRC